MADRGIPITDPRYRNLISFGMLGVPIYDVLPDQWEGADIIAVRSGTQVVPVNTYYLWDGTAWQLAGSPTSAATTWAFTGIISPTQISSNQNNYNPTGLSGASVIRLDVSSNMTITGLAGGATGRWMLLENTTTFSITLSHDSASSSSGNKFYAPNRVDYTIFPLGSVNLWYDATLGFWMIVGTSVYKPTLVLPAASLDVHASNTLGMVAWRGVATPGTFTLFYETPPTVSVAQTWVVRRSADGGSGTGGSYADVVTITLTQNGGATLVYQTSATSVTLSPNDRLALRHTAGDTSGGRARVEWLSS